MSATIYNVDGQSTILTQKEERKAFDVGVKRAHKCPSFKIFKKFSYLFPQLVVWKCIVDDFIIDKGFEFYLHCSKCSHLKDNDLDIQVLVALLAK